jgi:hypothetical protein
MQESLKQAAATTGAKDTEQQRGEEESSQHDRGLPVKTV